MEYNPTTVSQRDLYFLLDSLIIPRPIAWVSTQDTNGINNLAPFSFFNGVSSNPPALSFAVGYHRNRATGHKDTLANILALGEFVVNVVSEAQAAAMVQTSADQPPNVDEFALAGLHPVASTTVKPPRVGDAPACFECILHGTMQVGNGPGSSTLLVGIITHVFVRDELLTPTGVVDTSRLQVIGRAPGNAYCRINDLFDVS